MHVPNDMVIWKWRLGDGTVSVQEIPCYNKKGLIKYLSPSLI